MLNGRADMILIVDAGNTDVNFFVYDDKKIVYQDRLMTKRDDLSDYYYSLVHKISLCGFRIDGYIISSVVPLITDHLVDTLRSVFKMDGLVVNSALVSDLKIELDNRDELGADLIATTYGVMAKYELPAIVADLGTATKISIISKDKVFQGGIIVPGVSIAKKAMELMIPHLPVIEPILPDRLINRDTIKSMQAGLLYGTIHQVRGLVLAVEEEMGFKATKILTGGYSRFINHKLPEFIYDETLLNDGLLAIYHQYK